MIGEDKKMVMPDNVVIYMPSKGGLIHLRPYYGGGNTKKKTLDEVDFLERLESGKGCRKCCGSDMMIEIIKKDLKKKEISCNGGQDV